MPALGTAYDPETDPDPNPNHDRAPNLEPGPDPEPGPDLRQVRGGGRERGRGPAVRPYATCHPCLDRRAHPTGRHRLLTLSLTQGTAY
eukprot:scaffold71641_cov48-Phaeocystis_antarctica.AAC.2